MDDYFAEKARQCDVLMAEPAAFRWFLNWYDDTPRETVFRELGGEIRRELKARKLSDIAEDTAVAR